jgi:hypothetical protein
MQLLKASARLPALADIAAWRSHSTASWLAVLLPGLSPAAGGALLAAPVGDGAGAAHAAKRISAASNPIFMIHPCSAISGDAPLFVAFPASGANTFFWWWFS